MNDHQKDVLEFHCKLGFSAPDRVEIPSQAEVRKRARLMGEEHNELLDAMIAEDPAQVAAECVDLLYVVYGTAVAYGLDLEPFWRAIHAANMKKEPNPDGGKAIKPEGWKPINPAEILRQQI